MQFRDLKKQYEVLKKDIDKAMLDVCSSGLFIGGPNVSELEKELAEYVGVKHCITVANGTDALTLALMAWGIKEGDAVFVPDFTFFASAEVVSFEGATPVFVDVEQDTFNISVSDLEKAIEEVLAKGELNPRVIVGVDLFGLPANYPTIRKVAEKYNLLVLEDGAQGFGGAIGTQRACSFGDISTTSFFPAKPLGCYGDGGAIFTNNDEWAALIHSYKVHGKGSFKYDNVRIGINSRLDAIQAAILRVKFEAFRDYELEDVNSAAGKYTKLLEEKFICPTIPEGFYSSWAQYTLVLESEEERAEIQERLKAVGIPSMIYYPTPMSAQTAFADGSVRKGETALALCKRVLSLPIHPYISDEEINQIVEILCQKKI